MSVIIGGKYMIGGLIFEGESRVGLECFWGVGLEGCFCSDRISC